MWPKVALSVRGLEYIGKRYAFLFASLMVVVTAVDSQFVKLFYGTDLGTPGNFQLLLFVFFVIVASFFNIVFLVNVRAAGEKIRTGRAFMFKAAYIGISAIQYTLLLILSVLMFQSVFFQGYAKLFSLLIVYLSHISSAVVLGMLSFIFVQWFRASKSFSMFVYALVFVIIVLLIIVAIPFLTEQFNLQPEWIYPRNYIAVILDLLVPSSNMSNVYGLGTYALPLMVTVSWILTVLLLRPYSGRIGKMTFWSVVSIPLIYQLFALISNTNLITDPRLVEIIYTRQFQFLISMSYQISGIFFAFAFWVIGRKIKLENMKSYLTISSIGILLLFSSLQPGTAFYAAYPPFGLVTISVLGLSSYMLLTGLVGAAAQISRNTEVRKEIYKGLEENSHILKMGMAEMEREIRTRVGLILNKIESSGLEDDMRVSMEPDEEDVQDMINEVLSEVHSRRPRSTLKEG